MNIEAGLVKRNFFLSGREGSSGLDEFNIFRAYEFKNGLNSEGFISRIKGFSKIDPDEHLVITNKQLGLK